MTTLASLVPALDRLGYFRHYLALGDGNLRTWDWNLMAEQLDPAARVCWRFFLCGASVPYAKLTDRCPRAAVDRLVELGLAHKSKTSIALIGTVLMQYMGHPIFLETEQPSRSRLGDDVIAVLNQVPSGTGREVLCLHSVGGTDALYFAGTGERRVTAVVPTSGQGHARANWEINGGSSGSGSGLRLISSADALPGGHEDLILARLPSLAMPEAYVGIHPDSGGGEDGTDHLRAALAVAATRLKKDGCLVFAGMILEGDEPASAVKRLGNMGGDAGLNLEAEILSRQRLEPGVAVFNQMIFLAEKSTQKNVRVLIDEFMEFYQERGMTHVYFAKGVARRKPARGRCRHRILELTDRYFGTWTV